MVMSGSDESAAPVIVLNGTSSSGKTTIAHALQDLMPEPYVHLGVDAFLPRISPRFTTVAAVGDGAEPEYFLLLYDRLEGRTEGERPEGRYVHGGGVLVEVQIGPAGVALLEGMYRSIAALSRSGVPVIIDDVIHDRRVLKAVSGALYGLPTLFVGLYLPREEAERRERDRGDRGPGGALLFFDRVHRDAEYDLTLDTSVEDATSCARAIARAIGEGPRGTALQRLRDTL